MCTVQATKLQPNISKLWQFLWVVNQFSKLFPSLADKSKLFYDVLSTKNLWMWWNALQDTTKQIKEVLSFSKALALYDPTQKTIPSDDAPSYGLGAVLHQKQSNEDLWVIAYIMQLRLTADCILIQNSNRNRTAVYRDREGSTGSNLCPWTVYAKTYNLMAKRKWWRITHACVHVLRGYMQWSRIHPYNCQCIAPYLGQNEFFMFSKARFSKRLERFCSTLLLYTATMVWTSIKPRFSFWNECYRFAPNSKFQSAREDWETHERVELLRKK